MRPNLVCFENFLLNFAKMTKTSRVRTKTIKKAAKAVINEYEMKLSRHDFQTNKHVVQEFMNRRFTYEVTDNTGKVMTRDRLLDAKQGGPQTKKLRNKIAGYVSFV